MKKKLYCLQLNWVNLLALLLSRIVGYNIYFLTASAFWQKESRLKKLSTLGITWLSYQNFTLDKSVNYLVQANKFRERLRENLMQTHTFQQFMSLINQGDRKENEIISLLVKRLNSELQQLSELCIFAEFLEKENDTNKRFWLPNSVVTRIIMKKEPGCNNICPRWWSILESFIRLIGRIFKVIVGRIKHMHRFSSNSMLHGQGNEYAGGSNQNQWSNYETLFFPHKGIWYGEMFVKDHFYSSIPESPFHPSKILHMSLGEDKFLLKRSFQYYKEKNIPYADWADVTGLSIKEKLVMCIRISSKLLASTWKDWDVSVFVAVIRTHIAVQSNMLRLQQFPKLKNVLVGYDILFPLELSLACKEMNITTVAVQERMISAWWTWPLLIDHYFIYGSAASKILDKRFNGLIKHKYEIGPIRLADHQKTFDKKEELKVMLPDYKWRVLVLDFHSSLGWYNNGRCLGNNWRNNLRFYKDIINLCDHFPQAYFMIKGKNNDFLNIPYFSEIKTRTKQTPNCMVVKDYEQWTPFTSSAISDIAVAMHTSLGDEMLALGKPVIFYDFFGFPSQIIDYGSELIAHTYEDLIRKLERYFHDPKAYNNELNPVRKKFYTVPDIPVKELLHGKLNEIYDKNS